MYHPTPTTLFHHTIHTPHISHVPTTRCLTTGTTSAATKHATASSKIKPLRCILPHSTRCAWNICVAEPSLVLYLSRHRPPVLSAPAEFHTRSPDFALFIHPLHSFVGLHSLLTRSPHSLHLSLALLAHHPRARAPQKPFNPGRRWEIPVLLREQRRL